MTLDKRVKELIQIIKKGSSSHRIQAIKELGNNDDSAVIKALEKSLYDEDIKVRIATIEALGRADTPRAAKQLLKQIFNYGQEGSSVSVLAASALGGFKHSKSLKHLSRLFETPSLKKECIAAVRSFEKNINQTTQDVLLANINHSDKEIAVAVIEALGCFDHDYVKQALYRKLYKSDSDFRIYAIKSIDRLLDHSQSEFVLQSRYTYYSDNARTAIKLLIHDNLEKLVLPQFDAVGVRLDSGEVVPLLQNGEAYDLLISYVNVKDVTSDEQTKAFDLLLLLNKERAQEAIIDLMMDKKATVQTRLNASKALLSSNYAHGNKYFVDAIEDIAQTHEDIPSKAIEALVGLDEPRVPTLLADMTKKVLKRMYIYNQSIFYSIPNDVLIPFCHDESVVIQKNAMEVLKRRGGLQVLKELAMILDKKKDIYQEIRKLIATIARYDYKQELLSWAERMGKRKYNEIHSILLPTMEKIKSKNTLVCIEGINEMSDDSNYMSDFKRDELYKLRHSNNKQIAKAAERALQKHPVFDPYK